MSALNPTLHAAATVPQGVHRQRGFWPGLVLAGSLAAAATALANLPALQALGLSALTLAIVLGIVVGNGVLLLKSAPLLAARVGSGVDFSKSTLLRAGIVLYGFRVTFQEIAGVGFAGLAVDVVVVAGVFGLATWLGTAWLKLDRETSMLIGAGSAICGAAAVMATVPRRSPRQRRSSWRIIPLPPAPPRTAR